MESVKVLKESKTVELFIETFIKENAVKLYGTTNEMIQ